MNDHNQAFIKSNMSPSFVSNMQVDLVMYIDMKGEIFCATPIKRIKNVIEPSPKRTLAALGVQCFKLKNPKSKNGFSGIIELPDSPPMIVSVRPVLTSKMTCPARGWLVISRYFDNRELNSLSIRTRLDLQAWELNDKGMPSDAQKVIKSLITFSKTTIRPLNEKSIAGYTLLSDVANRPICLLRVMLPRSIYEQRVQSVAYLMRLILGALIAFSLVILLTLERFAFSRLARLTKQVENIGGEITIARVDLPGRDEFSLLTDKINGMLGSLEQNSNHIRENEEKLRLYNENLERTVVERTQQLEHLALHDALTGLPNRALFMNRLELAWERGQRSRALMTVIFIDLDNFKSVNDTLGHDAGDQLLLGIADRLKSCIRRDTVARLGGDEFTILIEETICIEDAMQIAEKVSEVFSAPFLLGSRKIFASSSIGIAAQSEKMEAGDILLRNADAAMYVAKANGKSGYMLFDATVSDHAKERMEIEIDMRYALERNELFIEYQPLICLDSSKRVGVEALLR